MGPDGLSPHGRRAASALRSPGRSLRAASPGGGGPVRHAPGLGVVRRRAIDRRTDRGARCPRHRRRARRSEQPRDAQRHSARVRSRAWHRDLGGAWDARHHSRSLRRRNAGRPRFVESGVPAQHSVDHGHSPRAAESSRGRRGPPLAFARRRRGPAGCDRSRRRDLRVDLRRWVRVAERASAGRGGHRLCRWGRWYRSSDVSGLR